MWFPVKNAKKKAGIVCDEYEQVGHTSIKPIERKCTRCQVSKLE